MNFAAVFAGLALIAPALSAASPTQPQPVVIGGYVGDAMEPHITRDGRYLLFNNRNEPPADTNLHYAERLDDLTFRYRGEIAGVNTPALDGTPTTDRQGDLYFVSTRSYPRTFSTIHVGRFIDGRVSGVTLAQGISRREPGIVNFDVDVSPDGDALYFVDSRFERGRPKWARLVIAARQGASFQRLPDSDRLLRAVNVKGLVYAPCISADGLVLYFTRATIGPLGASASIYVATRPGPGAPFGPPRRLPIAGFVEGPSLSPDERSLYFHRRDGDRFAIYRAPVG